ncbi:protein fantom isoform X2 [Hippoglossus hippoglossus]|uniref:protein fantom isoform X2 n=1 Tax=Hippoglossus hippoglossus TaxID=8267 RepID=UPI00148C43FC|nr:protein fantom isoform X2 [Hippoglossus hippoglossus]
MSTVLDETAADVPVRDMAVNLSQLTAALQDSWVHQNARTRQDISRVSREVLEDRFLHLHDENLLLKEHNNNQEDKIKKLSTKLMKLVKDRGRMEKLAAGGAQPVSRVRDVEMEEMMEELQEKVRGLQAENEGLKQRLLVAKHQLINVQSKRPSPYRHVQSRVNTGLKKLPDDTSSPSQTRPKTTRNLDGGGRPPSGQLPRYGHSLLEESRAESRNLEKVIESQRSQMEEMEGELEQLWEQLGKKEAEYEERLLQVRQQQTNKLRSHVNDNTTMIKLQKQLADRSNAVTELEGRFLQLQESQRMLRASYDAAMLKVDELLAQLKDERLKSLEMKKWLQSSNTSKIGMEQLQQQICEVQQERDLLRENNEKLLNSAFDVSQQQKWQIQERQLKLQIAQLETALKADLVDKNEILDKIKAERDINEKLIEENKKLQIQFLEQKQQAEDLRGRLKFHRRENDEAELTEALLLIKKRKSQRSSDLGFLWEAEEGGSSSIQELRAAHAETIQELEKTRNILSTESKISNNYKVELEAVVRKMNGDKGEFEQKLERQAQLLDMRKAKIKKLEAQLRDIAYGTKTYVFQPDVTDEDPAEEALHLERGENLVELQIVSASLSPSALGLLGDDGPSTFCTYTFYLFEPHSTPVVTGHTPKYGFTSKYVVSVDDRFLDYLHRCSVTVELHQALGLDWRTLARGQLRLQQLLEQDGKVHGTMPLVASSVGLTSVGSVDYWLRLRIPMTETIRLYKERLKAVGCINTALHEEAQLQPSTSSWNDLSVAVRRCGDLRSRRSQQPSPYVVYRFFDFPDYPTAVVHDSFDPNFNDLQSFSVLTDVDVDQYLKSEQLQFYVFDYKEQQKDTYLGKAGVHLLPLAQDEAISGVFELSDASGLTAGHIEVTLKWKSAYRPPSGSVMTAEDLVPGEKAVEETEWKRERGLEEERKDKDVEETLQEEKEAELCFRHSSSLPDVSASKVPLPKLRQKKRVKDKLAARKVSFMDPSAADDQVESGLQGDEDTQCPSVSEGQLLLASQSFSDDSEISEEIIQDVEAAKQDHSESDRSDSDDCVVHGSASGRKPSERVRVEVVSLSLRAESRVAMDSSVVRLFVEYSLLDLPTEETPVSLPKPPQGKSINFNHSKVVPVDAENNGPRRRLLRGVLQGRHPETERIKFTVVSEPPEEEEQERECEDVGVAFVRIPEILERRRDLMETTLPVVDVVDSSQVVGSLVVSVEGLEALQAVMEDQDQDQDQDQEPAPVSFLLPSA